MCEIEVLNKRQGAKGLYIGRPSVLGNPFSIGIDGSRQEVIEKYEAWLREQWLKKTPVRAELIRLAQLHKAGQKLSLVCWCAPLPCHGHVLARAIPLIAAKL
jgi:hypothetical protein